MRTLFINPLVRKVSKHEPPHTVNPPVGPLSLIAYAREKRKRDAFCFLDADARQIEDWDLIKIIESFQPDVVGMTTTTLNINSVYNTANIVKKIDYQTKIVVGGAHATALPDQTLKDCNEIDIIVIGEGELTFLDLLNSFDSNKSIGKVKGIVIRENNHVRRSEPQITIPNLDILPMPAWDMVNLNMYHGNYPLKNLPQGVVLGSRGCPFRCYFCSDIVWFSCRPRFRYKHPKLVADEIEYLVDEKGAKDIFLYDDEFNSKKAYTTGLCKEIVNKGLNEKMGFKCQLRVDLLDREIAEWMKKANCYMGMVGIESANERVLKGIRKGISVRQIREALEILKVVNIETFGFFMLFNIWESKNNGKLEWETPSEVRNTISYVKSLRNQGLLNHVQFTITTPYPGSMTYETALKYDLILDRDFSKWHTHDCVIKIPDVSKDEIMNVYNEAWDSFKISPLYVVNRLMRIRSPEELIRFIQGGGRIIKRKSSYLISKVK